MVAGEFTVRHQNIHAGGLTFEKGDKVGVAVRARRGAGVEGLMATAREIAMAAERGTSATGGSCPRPHLSSFSCAAIGPLFVVLLYSFMVKGDYGDVKFGHFPPTAGSTYFSPATSLTTR